MAREKPTIWGCVHEYPIEVVTMGSGERARCLGCGTCGPVREGSTEAMLALKAEARFGAKGVA